MWWVAKGQSVPAVATPADVSKCQASCRHCTAAAGMEAGQCRPLLMPMQMLHQLPLPLMHAGTLLLCTQVSV